MFIVHVFRPEARADYDGQTESHEAWEANPFEGIDILGAADDIDEADQMIHLAALDHPLWHFHIWELKLPEGFAFVAVPWSAR